MIDKNKYKEYLETKERLSSLKSSSIELNKEINFIELEIRSLSDKMKDDFKGFEEISSTYAKSLKGDIIKDKVVDLSFENGGHIDSNWDEFASTEELTSLQKKYIKRIGTAVKKYEMDVNYLVEYAEKIGLEIESSSSKLIERIFEKIFKEIPHKMLSSDDISELKEIIYKFVKYLKEL
jgi:predicted  nucleic acid-binding Zn-ribbon protein